MHNPNWKQSPTTEDYAALGVFVASCSLLEICLHAGLKWLIGIDDHLARMLIGEPRVGDLAALLKKVAEHRKFDKDRTDFLLSLTAEVTFSNKIRSIVAHKPFFAENGEMVFHNSVTAKSVSAIYKYRCTAEQLRNLADLTHGLAGDIVAISTDGVAAQDLYNQIRTRQALFQKLPLPAIPGQSQ